MVKLKQYILKVLTRISPVLNTQILYRHKFGKWLNLKNPRTSNEKVLWLKLNTYYNNPLITQCADKYAVRQYVEDNGCREILNDLLGVWSNPDDVDFEILPDKFVLKSNYFCHLNLICIDKSKLDIASTRKELKRWMHNNDHLIRSEMQYEHIPRKIIAERFIETDNNTSPNDYKIYCCNGKPLFVMVCIGRTETEKPRFYYFDTTGKLQSELSKDGINAPEDLIYTLPIGWKEMIHYAEILSQPFPFVRADFYLENGRTIFGELTFTPSAGLDTEKLEITDKLIGDMIKLPK